MSRRIALIWITSVGLAAWCSQVWADDSSLAQAEEHFDKAQSLYQAGEYDRAAEAFLAAYEARPLPPLLFNVGAAYEKLAKSDPGNVDSWDKAIEYYRRYLEAVPEAEDRDAIEERIAVLEGERERIAAEVEDSEPAEMETSAEVEALEEVTIRGMVVIESDPPSATIYLDDRSSEPLGKTPWSGTIEGTRTILIEHEGYKPREITVAPSPDKLIVLSVALAEEGYLGWVDITSNVPGADIYIDDRSIGVFAKTPFSGNLKPGKHTIWVTAEGYDTFSTEVEIVAGRTHAVNAQLEGAPVGYINIYGQGMNRATVYLDGEVLCKRGPCRKAVRRGEHKLEVKRSGHKTFARTINVDSDTEMMLKIKLAEVPGRGDAVWAYIFSAAFAGGGVYLGLRARDIYDELEAEIDAGTLPPDNNDPRFSRGKLFTIGADVAYGLAGLTLLTAVYYTVRDKGPPSTGIMDVRAVSMQPHLAPGYAGLGMEVMW